MKKLELRRILLLRVNIQRGWEGRPGQGSYLVIIDCNKWRLDKDRPCKIWWLFFLILKELFAINFNRSKFVRSANVTKVCHEMGYIEDTLNITTRSKPIKIAIILVGWNRTWIPSSSLHSLLQDFQISISFFNMLINFKTSEDDNQSSDIPSETSATI